MNEVDETAAGSSVDRRPPVHPLDLPRLIAGVLGDIRAIAEGMAVLPRVLDTLMTIETSVDELNTEVRLMRQGVDGLGGDVGKMEASLNRLEPHLEDVTRVVHPLRRLSGRARKRDGEIEEELDPLDPAAIELEPEAEAMAEVEAEPEP